MVRVKLINTWNTVGKYQSMIRSLSFVQTNIWQSKFGIEKFAQSLNERGIMPVIFFTKLAQKLIMVINTLGPTSDCQIWTF